jgi:hypothetical protein
VILRRIPRRVKNVQFSKGWENAAKICKQEIEERNKNGFKELFDLD